MFCSNEQFSFSCRPDFQVDAYFFPPVVLKQLNDFSERCGVASFFGPKRFRPPALTVNDLPDDLDAIFISHNHFDHLDYPSVKELNKRYGKQLTWFCGRGTRKWFLDNYVKNIVDLDWWEEYYFAVRKDSF
jgi:L-ascorbate metabolism protein UlaG (beta-lactamase superfamily)